RKTVRCAGVSLVACKVAAGSRVLRGDGTRGHNSGDARNAARLELAQEFEHAAVEFVAAPVFVANVFAFAIQNSERAAEAPQRPAPSGLLPEAEKVTHPGERYGVRRAIPAAPFANKDACTELFKVLPRLDAPTL